MKYLIFFSTIIFGMPLLIAGCRLSRRFTHACFFMMILSLISPIEFSITFAARQYYRAATTGFEIHLADIFIWSIMFAFLSNPDRYRVRVRHPLQFLLIVGLILGFISWFQGGTQMPVPAEGAQYDKRLLLFNVFEPHLYPLFELSKWIRGYLVIWVSLHYLRLDKARMNLIRASVALLFLLVLYGIVERYVFGIYRVSANLGHANDYNGFLAMIGLFLFPQAWRSQSVSRSLFFWLCTLAALVGILLTVSRSSLFVFLICISVFSLVLIIRFPSTKNYITVVLGACLALLFLGKSAGTLLERFIKESYGYSMEERSLHREQALMMVKDYPFGVGLGNFSAMSWLKYAELSGAPPGTPAHNIFYLTLAETGWLGLLVFNLIFLKIYWYLIRMAIYFSRSDQPDAFLFNLGLIGSFSALLFQNWYHYSFRNMSVFFLFCVYLGSLIATYLDYRDTGDVTIFPELKQIS